LPVPAPRTILAAPPRAAGIGVGRGSRPVVPDHRRQGGRRPSVRHGNPTRPALNRSTAATPARRHGAFCFACATAFGRRQATGHEPDPP
jgi:hypothetical protein